MHWQLFVSAFLLSGSASSLRLFFRGRGRYGNLGAPDINQYSVPSEQWHVQQLDHFNPSNTHEWKQRYFVNDSFFDYKNGPVFLMIGGEAEADPKWVVNGTWLSYAEKFKALCILLEHRFYGKSRPLGDLSVKNLMYLSSEQALADIASFITNYSNKLGGQRKWIVFGGSYPGSLAAWMRLKYPHLVHGAVSSSGPLLAEADFRDYYAVVENALSTYNRRCVEAIHNGTEQLSRMLEDPMGQQSVAKQFKLCDPIDASIKDDISNLYDSLASNFAGVVQYNKDNRHSDSSKRLDITIDLVCDIMMNKSAGIEVDRLATVNSLILEDNDETCLDYVYKKMVRDVSSSDWNSKAAGGMRQWTYQTCTEFGFFQTSTLNVTKYLFGRLFPLEFYEKQCKDIFGQKFNVNLLTKGILRTNTIYGGLNIQADNVVFVHGSVDPWHALGITTTLNVNAPAIYISGTAHCANMYPSSPKDLPQLISARKEIESLIEAWLSKKKLISL